VGVVAAPAAHAAVACCDSVAPIYNMRAPMSMR
jgi:hypothetical protein